jgi:phosphatidylserine decarboxylase
MSIKQGIKYDSPESKADILPFIAFHNLNLDEILDPLESFATFNQFFYRKLKPSARPVEQPGNEGRLVSCADCRMMAFETVDEATRIWIKGREFGVPRLLGDEYRDVWGRYDGGALAIFRWVRMCCGEVVDGSEVLDEQKAEGGRRRTGGRSQTSWIEMDTDKQAGAAGLSSLPLARQRPDWQDDADRRRILYRQPPSDPHASGCVW